MASTTALIGALLLSLLGLLAVRLAVRSLLIAVTDRAPHLLTGLARSRVWAGTVPFRTRASARYPRAFGFAAERFGLSGFSGLPLTMVVLAALAILALLAVLISDVRTSAGFVRLDEGVDAFFTPYRAPWLLMAFLWITAIGAGPSLTGMICCATALLWSGGRARLLLPLWISFLGAQATTWSSKYIIARPRPVFLPHITEWNPSFPSGHATASTALVGILGFIVALGLRGFTARFEVAFWTAVLVLIICFSRLFLGVHFLTDVAAGVLVGTFWLLVGASCAILIERRRAVGEGGNDGLHARRHMGDRQ